MDFSTTASTLTKLAWKTRFVEAYNFVGSNNSADANVYRKNLHTDQLDAFLDSLANIGYAHTLQHQFVADCLQSGDDMRRRISPATITHDKVCLLADSILMRSSMLNAFTHSSKSTCSRWFRCVDVVVTGLYGAMRYATPSCKSRPCWTQ